MRNSLKALLTILTALLLAASLTACGSSADTEATGATKEEKVSKKPEPTKEPKPKYNGKAYAKKVNKTMKTTLGGSINSRCDYSDMRWHCFFDKYESSQPGRINLHLSFPGDYSDSEKRDFSEQARTGTFNLAGMELEDLDSIVSYADGVDSGTTYRKDVYVLNR